MTILYGVLITPIGLIVRAVSDPFKARPQAQAPTASSVTASTTDATDTYWLPHAKVTDTVDEARRQF